jgi:hypothetical protein
VILTSTRFAKRGILGLLLGGACLFFLSAGVMSGADDPRPPKSSEGKLPEGYRLVSPEEWQRLQDELAQLRAQIKPDKPLVASGFKLTGRIDGDVAHLQARFRFATPRPKQSVLLGCPQGLPAAATLDGQAPTGFAWGENGWTVLVEKEGDSHEFLLEMDVPLETREANRGFELSLPGAPISRLELDLPGHARSVRVGNRTLTTLAVDPNTRRLETQLGHVEKLEVFWEADPNRPVASPSFGVDSRLRVNVTESALQTRADLIVKVLGGKPEGFWVQVPKDAEVKATYADNAQPSQIDKNDENARFVPIKPGTDQVRLEVSFSRQIVYPRPRSWGNVNLLPVTVVGAVRQRGTVVIAKPDNLQVRYVPRGDGPIAVSPREITKEDREIDPMATASFSYWNPAVPEKPTQPVPALLQLEVKKSEVPVEAHAVHTLSLEPSERGGLAWHLRSQLDLAFSAGVASETLNVQLPPDFLYNARKGLTPALPGQGPPDEKRVLQIVLDKPERKLSVAFEGEYAPLSADSEEVTLPLPTVPGTLDRGAEIKIETPRGYKLVPARPNDPAWEPSNGDASRSPQKHSWKSARTPDKVELAWRPYQPEVAALSVVDLLIGERQAHVTQRMTLHSPQESVDGVVLRVPIELVSRLVLIGADGKEYLLDKVGYKVKEPSKPRDGEEYWQVRLKPRASGAGTSLILRSYFGIPGADAAAARQLPVLLVRPDEVNSDRVTSMETVVRVFERPGVIAVPAGDRWEEIPGAGIRETDATEPLAELSVGEPQGSRIPRRLPQQGAQPDKVLHSRGLDVPLALRLSEPGDTSLAAALVEAALVRVQVGDDGSQSYRISLRLARLRGPTLDLELPVSSANLNNLRIALRSAEEAGSIAELRWEPVDNTGSRLGSSKILRVDLDPYVIRKQAVLEIAFQFSGAPSGTSRNSWTTRLQPVTVRGDLGTCEVIWTISLPASWLPLLRGSGTGGIGDGGDMGDDMGWGLRGFLLGPQSVRSRASLERWIQSDGPLTDLAPTNGGDPSLIIHGAGLEPVRVIHVPQQLWLLACSVALFAWVIGLWLAAKRGRAWFLAVLVPVLLAVAALAVFLPGLFAALVYGVQPGALVVGVLFLLQWAVQRRYRRQIVFMPGFQRMKPGSSLIRSSKQRLRHESSTKDIPAAAANVWASGSAPEAAALPPAEAIPTQPAGSAH